MTKFLSRKVPHQQPTRVAVTLHLHQKWALWIYNSLCQIHRQRILHYLIFITLIIREIKRFKPLVSLLNYLLMSFAHFSIVSVLSSSSLIFETSPVYLGFNSLAWLFLNVIWSGGFWPSHLMMAEVTHERNIQWGSHVTFVIKVSCLWSKNI